MQKTQLDSETVKSIENVLLKGDRVEIIPVKDGVKVMRIRREVIKFGDNKTG